MTLHTTKGRPSVFWDIRRSGVYQLGTRGTEMLCLILLLFPPFSFFLYSFLILLLTIVIYLSWHGTNDGLMEWNVWVARLLAYLLTWEHLSGMDGQQTGDGRLVGWKKGTKEKGFFNTLIGVCLTTQFPPFSYYSLFSGVRQYRTKLICPVTQRSIIKAV